MCGNFGIETEVFGFEFDVEVLRKLMGFAHMYKPFSRFPYVEKDLAFVVDRDINAEQVYRVIEQTGKLMVNYIRVFDLYQGDRLPEDKKSLAFRIRFQSSERTLTDPEVNEVFQRIIKMVQEKLPATLRE